MYICELYYQILDCQNEILVAQGSKRCKTKAVCWFPPDFTKKSTCLLEKELWMNLLNKQSIEVMPCVPHTQDTNEHWCAWYFCYSFCVGVACLIWLPVMLSWFKLVSSIFFCVVHGLFCQWVLLLEEIKLLKNCFVNCIALIINFFFLFFPLYSPPPFFFEPVNIHWHSGVLEEWLLVPCVQLKLWRV